MSGATATLVTRIILIATREALAVHITTAGTIAPTGVVAVATERIIGADGGTGRMGPRALASLIGRIDAFTAASQHELNRAYKAARAPSNGVFFATSNAMSGS